MGAAESDRARECAVEIERRWERSHNFDLYDDALPTLELLRGHGLKIGLVSNGARDIDEFVTDHGLEVDAAIGSRGHGWTKPHPSIFRAALERLGVEPEEAAMVGDSPEDDIEGAKALGMRAFLLDREDLHPEREDRLTDLRALPAALGLKDLTQVPDWVLWVILAAALAIGEVLTLGFLLGLFGARGGRWPASSPPSAPGSSSSSSCSSSPRSPRSP